MKIGIDISQLAYKNTGVANYLENLVVTMLAEDNKNEYVLFFSSMRNTLEGSPLLSLVSNANVTLRSFRIPPTLLDLLWNRLHILPVETLIGDVDIFITSDWTEPPTKKAKKATILYDVVVYKHPGESDKKIVATQKRKLALVKKESDMILCISEATKKDALRILGIEEKKLRVVYPGLR